MSQTKFSQMDHFAHNVGIDIAFLQQFKPDDATPALARIIDSGVNFIATSDTYRDCNEKIGNAISSRRGEFVLSSTTAAGNAFDFWRNLDRGLELLNTSHFDIYQFQNPEKIPHFDDGSGLYEGMMMARNQGKLKHIGVSTFRFQAARETVLSGLYDVLQFPFCYLSDERAFDLIRLCKENDVAFIACDVLGSGLISGCRAAREWLLEYESITTLWAPDNLPQFDSLLSMLAEAPQGLTEEERELIDSERRGLGEEYRQRVFRAG
jgi:aryl-alcohol dehydrogenase-like predicted oxidoreductase